MSLNISPDLKVILQNRKILDAIYSNIKRAIYKNSVSQKNPPCGFLKFFPNGWEFLIIILHTYYAIISTLEDKFSFKYLQLWQSYAILSANT